MSEKPGSQEVLQFAELEMPTMEECAAILERGRGASSASSCSYDEALLFYLDHLREQGECQALLDAFSKYSDPATAGMKNKS